MAHAKERSNGKFTAVYLDLQGREKSAGTFIDKAEAAAVAEAQEAYIRGRMTGVSPEQKANMTVAEYGTYWLSTRISIEPTTRKNYRGALNKHIVPRLGTLRVSEVPASAVRALIVDMAQTLKLKQTSQKRVRTVLSQMFKLAVAEGYRTDNPALGIEVTRQSRKKIVVLTEEQFECVYNCLPTDGARVLANLIVSTGCRSGEAFTLRTTDIDWLAETITFERGLQDVGREDSEDGQRFREADNKTHDTRTISVDADLLEDVRWWIESQGIAEGELIFLRSKVRPEKRRRRKVKVVLTEELIATLGTVAAPSGKEYRHGTINAYTTAKCRCLYCGQASSDYTYKRLQIRGKAKPVSQSSRFYDESDFLHKEIWSDIWKDACKAAALPFMPTAYQLRHTHASWLIHDGKDKKMVADRLGHSSTATTDLYVHRVGVGIEGADSMAKLRTWGRKAS